jgi:rare lipoprotein A
MHRVFCSTLLFVIGIAGFFDSATAKSRALFAAERAGWTETGTASWYGPRESGRRTASGAIFDPARLTAAHRSLPLGTCVRVTHLANKRSVVVPIIDRGPYIRGRLIDLSQAAAQYLGIRDAGLAQVRVDALRTCL